MQVRRSRSAWTSIILALASLPVLMAPSAEAGVRPPFIFANAGGPYTISEGTALMLDGSGGCSPFGFCPIAGWDLTGDSVIDVSGFTPTIPFSDLIALDIDALGPHGITLIVGDLSFISLRLVLPALAACATPEADLTLMVKPQFEVGRERLGSGGVVRDSVLSPDVRVNSYSEVDSSILFSHVNVGRHCRIRRAIIDRDVRIPEGSVIGYDTEADRQRYFVTESGITVVTRDYSLFENPVAVDYFTSE